MRTLRLIAGLLLFGTILPMLSLPANARVTTTQPRNKLVIERTYTIHGHTHKLQIWRHMTESDSLLDVLRRKNPAETSTPNLGTLAFVLTDMKTHKEPGADARSKDHNTDTVPSIVFVHYAAPHGGYPRAIYSFDMLPVGTHNAYIVMSRSIGGHVAFYIYKVDLAKSLAKYPFAFTKKNYSRWPKALPALSEHKKVLKKEVCGIGHIDAIIHGPSLLIRGQRVHKSCPSVYVKFDVVTQTWKDVTSKTKVEMIDKAIQRRGSLHDNAG